MTELITTWWPLAALTPLMAALVLTAHETRSWRLLGAGATIWIALLLALAAQGCARPRVGCTQVYEPVPGAQVKRGQPAGACNR